MVKENRDLKSSHETGATPTMTTKKPLLYRADAFMKSLKPIVEPRTPIKFSRHEVIPAIPYTYASPHTFHFTLTHPATLLGTLYVKDRASVLAVGPFSYNNSKTFSDLLDSSRNYSILMLSPRLAVLNTHYFRFAVEALPDILSAIYAQLNSPELSLAKPGISLTPNHIEEMTCRIIDTVSPSTPLEPGLHCFGGTLLHPPPVDSPKIPQTITQSAGKDGEEDPLEWIGLGKS